MSAAVLLIAGVLCAQPNETLNLTLTPAHREISEEDPLFFKVRLENTGNSTIVFRMPVAAMLHSLGLQVRKSGDPAFRSVRLQGSDRDVIVASQHLRHSHVFASHEVLLAGAVNDWSPTPGEYEFRAEVRSEMRTYYSLPVTIRVQPIGDEDRAKIDRVRQLLPGLVSASSLSTEAPSRKLLDLEEVLSPCVLKETLHWSREWTRIMRDEPLSDEQRTAALEELSYSLDDVTAEVFACITARHYMRTEQWVAALRELEKLPEQTYQANSIRKEVLYRLDSLLK